MRMWLCAGFTSAAAAAAAAAAVSAASDDALAVVVILLAGIIGVSLEAAAAERHAAITDRQR